MSDTNHLDAYRAELVSEGYTFRPTTEDWYPNFPGNTVGIVTLPEQTGFRILVRGADNTGMEALVPTEDAARALYDRIPSVVTRAALACLGFRRS